MATPAPPATVLSSTPVSPSRRRAAINGCRSHSPRRCLCYRRPFSLAIFFAVETPASGTPAVACVQRCRLLSLDSSVTFRSCCPEPPVTNPVLETATPLNETTAAAFHQDVNYIYPVEGFSVAARRPSRAGPH